MEPTSSTRARARSRDEALRLLQKLTVGSSIAAFIGVGVFAVVGEQTIPGTAASSSSSTNASTSTSGDDSSTSSSSNNSSSTIQSSGISSSSGNAVAVTGGSR